MTDSRQSKEYSDKKGNLQKKICEDFGADLDSQVCREVSLLLDECPECRVYYDTMKRSVKLYRIVEDECEIPDAVSERLFKVLNLDDIKNEV